jgi:TPP-dependent 2-oxoacid decarboxylase
MLNITPSSFGRYEFQMQYGSIGWSVGATLGYAQAAKDKRVISFIGDGSFQVPKIQNAETSCSIFIEICIYISRFNWTGT